MQKLINKVNKYVKDKQISKQQEIAREVLRKLKILDSKCIVAGGAPRDWYLGNTAVDIDYYMSADVDHVLSSLHELGLKTIAIKYPEDFVLNYSSCSFIDAIIDVEYKGLKNQIMVSKEYSPMDIVDDFPVSISKCTFNLVEGIKTCIDFDVGFKDKIIYINKSYEEDHPYIKKIVAKFPTWGTFRCSDDEMVKIVIEYIKERRIYN